MPAISDGITINVAAPDKPLALRAIAGTVAQPSKEAEAYLATWRTIEKRVISVKLDPRGQLSGVSFADDPDNKTSQRARDEIYARLLGLAIPLLIGAGLRALSVAPAQLPLAKAAIARTGTRDTSDAAR